MADYEELTQKLKKVEDKAIEELPLQLRALMRTILENLKEKRRHKQMLNQKLRLQRIFQRTSTHQDYQHFLERILLLMERIHMTFGEMKWFAISTTRLIVRNLLYSP